MSILCLHLGTNFSFKFHSSSSIQYALPNNPCFSILSRVCVIDLETSKTPLRMEPRILGM